MCVYDIYIYTRKWFLAGVTAEDLVTRMILRPSAWLTRFSKAGRRKKTRRSA